MTDREELWPGGPVLRQAAHARLGTDCVLLADFVPTGGAARGIDLGCGAGLLSLLLLSQTEKLQMCGLELDAQAAALALGIAEPPGAAVPKARGLAENPVAELARERAARSASG